MPQSLTDLSPMYRHQAFSILSEAVSGKCRVRHLPCLLAPVGKAPEEAYRLMSSVPLHKNERTSGLQAQMISLGCGIPLPD
jgi:hypothetical protein